MRASAAEDFSNMNPTVKVTSYKKLFIDDVSAYGSGSGTVISSDGVVVTNHHVIFNETDFVNLDAFEICITFDTKKEPVCKYTARLIANDKDMDIALLKINAKDVFGNTLPALKYLNYKNSPKPTNQDTINVAGYPGSGGNTITITKGQISGSEKYNNYNYFKTDTDFDHGSSGGTALDASGNFIGIPTYLRSYAANVGYFLDISEAKSWISNNVSKAPTEDKDAEGFLTKNLARLSMANADLKYIQEKYPYMSINLPNGWEFLELNEDSFYITQKNLSNPVSLSFLTLDSQFEIDKAYMDEINKEMDKYKENYPDFKKEEVTFAGTKGWKATFTSYSNKNTTYYIPYGYSLIMIQYSIDLDESAKQEKLIEPVLKSFNFTKSVVNNPNLPTVITFSEPNFSISSADKWILQRNFNKQSASLLIEGSEKDNFKGNFAVYYKRIPKDEKSLTDKERLDDRTKNLYGDTLVYKNDKVVLGGLEGFVYTYEYEGSEYQEMKKSFNMKLRNGDYEFTFVYDDLSKNFDKNLPSIKKILNSFKFQSTTTKDKNTYSYGSLNYTFKDIQFHRYALAISDLADKEIVKGYDDGNFYPEKSVTRAEALKMILESKNHLEKKNNSKKAVDFDDFEEVISYFWDIKDAGESFVKYINYASDKKLVNGYANKRFKPNNSVTLAEALKIITNVYEISIWQNETEPWYKKYMEKGFELNIIPYGMYNPSQKLTRAELSYLISTVYKQAKY